MDNSYNQPNGSIESIKETKVDFDVVIIGGGPAGCATAISLRQNSNLSVLLVERGSFDRLSIGETIPPDVRPLLNQLGLWPRFSSDGHVPCIGSMSIWGSGTPGFNDYLINPNGPGWHLNRRLFDDMFLSAIIGAGVEVRLGLSLKDIEPSKVKEGQSLLTLQDNDCLSFVNTSFVIDASGQQAVIGKKMNAKRQKFDRTAFIIGQFKIADENGFPNHTLLEGKEEGWWYAAKVPNNRVMVACATDGKEIKKNTMIQPETWMKTLAESKLIAPNLINAKFDNASFFTKTSFSFLLTPCFGSNWVAVGDAAASYDPITSSGIYKGINSGIECSEALLAHIDGDKNALAAYGVSRQKEFEDYERVRTHLYKGEQRWKNAPFWKNRITATIGSQHSDE